MLGKTWEENHLGLMHHGTIRAPGGKLSKKPNTNLHLLHDHLVFPAPAPLEDLGWGRGGLQLEGSGNAWVGEEKGVGLSWVRPATGNSWKCPFRLLV